MSEAKLSSGRMAFGGMYTRGSNVLNDLTFQGVKEERGEIEPLTFRKVRRNLVLMVIRRHFGPPLFLQLVDIA